MKNIIEKIAAYDNCVQGLLDKLDEYLETVKKEIPREFWGDFMVRDFGNHQFDWIAISCKGKVIPFVTKECGGRRYAFNDFNCPREFATRKEVVEFAKNLPVLMNRVEEKIAQLHNEALSAV